MTGANDPLPGRRPPAHLKPWNAAAFQLDDVAAAYHLRAPYPPGLAPLLPDLTPPRGGPGRERVLELGCGTGAIARSLAPAVERVDAVDVSRPMPLRGRLLTGGTHPSLRWIEGTAEHVALDGPYALAVVSEAMHWMDWEVVLPRLPAALAPGARLALVAPVLAPPPAWRADLGEVISRYSVIRDFEPLNLDDVAAALGARGLFEREGEADVAPVVFTQSVEDYIGALHSTAGMPRERIGADRVARFDAEVRELLAPHAIHGSVTLNAAARVIWGTPSATPTGPATRAADGTRSTVRMDAPGGQSS